MGQDGDLDRDEESVRVKWRDARLQNVKTERLKVNLSLQSNRARWTTMSAPSPLATKPSWKGLEKQLSLWGWKEEPRSTPSLSQQWSIMPSWRARQESSISHPTLLRSWAAAGRSWTPTIGLRSRSAGKLQGEKLPSIGWRLYRLTTGANKGVRAQGKWVILLQRMKTRRSGF